MNDSVITLHVPPSISAAGLVVTCFERKGSGGRHEYLCRVGYANGRASGGPDVYYPYADVGVLWIRHEGDDVQCVSGMLKRKLFADAEALRGLTDFLTRELCVADIQGTCVELVDAVQCLIGNNEGRVLFDGDGEDGARFVPRG